MFRHHLPPLVVAALLALSLPNEFLAQPIDPNAGSVRVSVTLNPDGSRTTYEFDSPNHKAIATTAGSDGKTASKIVYKLDDQDRFASGTVYGPDGKFQFNTLYKYDAGGRVQEESRSQKDGTLLMRLVYAYDGNGRQSGYSVYDGQGKLIGKTTPVVAAPAAATPKPRKGR